ncbi:uncharacterized protein [Clytia hemisphaerica]|uniref:Uncharacterized protein n=1 Tax=Clytia hemisphaerica TaxID=252671 RepID=A0A7M5XGY0_9CNID
MFTMLSKVFISIIFLTIFINFGNTLFLSSGVSSLVTFTTAHSQHDNADESTHPDASKIKPNSSILAIAMTQSAPSSTHFKRMEKDESSAFHSSSSFRKKISSISDVSKGKMYRNSEKSVSIPPESSTGKSTVSSTTTVTPQPTNQPIATEAIEVVHTHVNMNASFLKELDELDAYMINISKYESECGMVKSEALSFCEDIDYPVPKQLALAPYFQDNMAKAAVETLSILTEGGTTQCESELKKVFCSQKFPRCNDYKLEMYWQANDTSDCSIALSKCSAKSVTTLKKMKLCEKLSRGAVSINKCIAPLKPSKKDLCAHHNNVSTWLYHSNVEINSLLYFQYSLNDKLSIQCKSNLTKHMCSFGLQCFSGDGIFVNSRSYLSNVQQRCEETVKACANQELSSALTQMFLNCKKFV